MATAVVRPAQRKRGQEMERRWRVLTAVSQITDTTDVL